MLLNGFFSLDASHWIFSLNFFHWSSLMKYLPDLRKRKRNVLHHRSQNVNTKCACSPCPTKCALPLRPTKCVPPPRQNVLSHAVWLLACCCCSSAKNKIPASLVKNENEILNSQSYRDAGTRGGPLILHLALGA